MAIRWLLICLTMLGSMSPGLGEAQGVEGEGAASGEKVSDVAEVSRQIISRTNSFRQAEGVGAVEPQVELGNASQDFAGFMARTDRYGHTADGKTPAERAQQHGYEYCLIAENVAYLSSPSGFTTAELGRRFFEGWQQSPEHRENMLNAAVTDTGVGVARSERSGNYYAVQMFGRPKSRTLEFRISNRAGVDIRYELGGQTLSLPPQSTRTHQTCELGEVIIQWPNGQESTAVQPGHDEHYTIIQGEAETFRLEKL